MDAENGLFLSRKILPKMVNMDTFSKMADVHKPCEALVGPCTFSCIPDDDRVFIYIASGTAACGRSFLSPDPTLVL